MQKYLEERVYEALRELAGILAEQASFNNARLTAFRQMIEADLAAIANNDVACLAEVEGLLEQDHYPGTVAHLHKRREELVARIASRRAA